MDLHDYLEVLRRRWISVVIVALATVAVCGGRDAGDDDAVHRHHPAVLCRRGQREQLTDLAQGSSFAEKQMTSYAEVATSPLVLDPVIDRLNLETTSTDLARTVTAVIPPDTVILEISAVDPDPKRAAAIANADRPRGRRRRRRTLAGAGRRQQGRTGHHPGPGAGSDESVVAEGAAQPHPRRAPRPDPRPRRGPAAQPARHQDPQRARRPAVTESPLLGVIGQDDKVPAHPIILRDEPLSAAAESVRRLRTNLKFTRPGRPSALHRRSPPRSRARASRRPRSTWRWPWPTPAPG